MMKLATIPIVAMMAVLWVLCVPVIVVFCLFIAVAKTLFDLPSEVASLAAQATEDLFGPSWKHVKQAWRG